MGKGAGVSAAFWIPSWFTKEQANVLAQVALLSPDLAQRMVDAFSPPPAATGARRGIKPTVPREVIDAWLGTMPFEWLATFKQLEGARMSLLDQALDASKLPPAMAIEWDAGCELDSYTRAEARRALKRNIIQRAVELHGGAIQIVGLDEVQTLECFLRG
jgi:hypothetical protein